MTRRIRRIDIDDGWYVVEERSEMLAFGFWPTYVWVVVSQHATRLEAMRAGEA